MTSTQTPVPEDIRAAAERFVEALMEMPHLAAFHRVIQLNLTTRQPYVDSTKPHHAPAVAALDTFLDLERLVAAVRAHRQEHHHD